MVWGLPRTSTALMDMTFMAVTTAFAAHVTISQRLILMTMPVTLVGGNRQREARLMVDEKIGAAVEGAMAASAEAQKLLISAALGPMTPDTLAARMIDVGLAATRPAERKARANARRLTRADG